MRSVRANGIRISFDEAGSGAPLLLLHGFSLDRTMWDAQVEALARSYRLIVPDLRGLGATENPGVQISIEQMADDAAGLLMALDIPAAAVAGFSMGGYVLAQMAVRHPLKVRAAAFVCTRAGADNEEQQKARLANMRFIDDEGSEAFASKFVPMLFSSAYLASGAGGPGKHRRAIASQLPRNLCALLDAMRQREDMTPRLGEIRVPCAVVAGEKDQLVPVQAMRELHEGLADSAFDVIEGSGHMAPVEAPDRVSFALDQLMQRAGMWM
ncbi:MAG: alpha/beta fold hydrolase [Candidatus Tectomicrobia bacterium]|uniref:Alpha/beta fold hydrolase n=1 Tax=Tectimicrobiota bacterium TaxID=2528274 RepID=A0A932I129_UNCTE|nr:alpha/beta fold hydrolase [Candidatus Tectomicrobia bacterium]